METSTPVMSEKERRQSKLLRLLKGTSSAGVLTFTNSQNRSDFLDRVKVYYDDLSEMGYKFTKQKEGSDEVVLIYSEERRELQNA